jgi:zinc transporter, ZIP family
MGAALAWGALAASSLVIGGFLGLARRWKDDAVGLVLAFGAGALISAVSFDLAEEGARIGGPGTLAIGLGAGALTYFVLDRLVERMDTTPGSAGGNPGPALALGALLDGIPEQAVLGIGIAAGEGVGIGLLVAIFVSNLPEAIGATTELRDGGHDVRMIRRLWAIVAVVCTAATVGGYALADSTTGDFQAVINGFAAGALLVMLVDSMIPDARKKAGLPAGLVTVLGFAVAAGLSGLS